MCRLLSSHRLLTLTGPGGIGKTRLAVRVAETSGDHWRDGVAFVDHTRIEDPGGVLGEIASALGLTPAPSQSLEDRVVEHLYDRHLLLVLDGCEVFRGAVARTAELLLGRCAELHVLATSRDPLEMTGEVLMPVPPLSLPADVDAGSVEDLREYEAIRFFEERAAASLPNFGIGPDTASDTLRICQDLDGIPLALELAAARLRMMSLADIRERLHDRFRLLSGGSTVRQHSLLATIDWSYQSLDEDERALFRGLSAFAGGFRLEAAEAVVSLSGADVLDGLGRLVDRSLLQADVDPDARTRYRMLECVRQFGLDRLQEADAWDEVRDRHLEHYLGVVRIAAEHEDDADWMRWLDLLESDHGNCLLALEWSHQRDPGRFVSLVEALGWFWQRRGDLSEGRRWLEIALAAPGPGREAELRLLRWVANMAAFAGDANTALQVAHRQLAVARESRSGVDEAHAHLALGNLLFFELDVEDRLQPAQTHYEAALHLYEEIGLVPRALVVLLNLSLSNLASGRIDLGREQAERAGERARAGGWDHLVRSSDIRLGIAAFLTQDDEEAERRFHACVNRERSRTSLGMSGMQIALLALAAIAGRRGQPRRAARLAGAASTLAAHELVRTALPRELMQVLEDWLARVRDALGATRYRTLHDAGGALAEPEWRRLALLQGGGEGDADGSMPISPRELEIVALVAEGLTNRELSARLGISTRTIEAHLDHVRNKLGLRTRTQMARWLFEYRQR